VSGNQGADARLPWGGVFRAAPAAAILATWFGAGFLPVAPGTWGSLLAVPFAEAAFRAGGIPGLVAFALVVSLVGIPAAGAVARLRAEEDPSEVVIDEVAGQALALLPVYALARAGPAGRFWLLAGIAFLLFRVVDVVKPGPVGKAERLPAGLGVMADDLLGGLLVALVLSAGLLLLR
jgi:phosphatidylglycerophosphatase A